MASNQLINRLVKCVRLALPRSLSICLWLFKVMLPISLAVRVLQYVGVIDWLAGYLSPVFSYIGLSGDSAFVFLTSIFLPLYPTIAVMCNAWYRKQGSGCASVRCPEVKVKSRYQDCGYDPCIFRSEEILCRKPLHNFQDGRP